MRTFLVSATIFVIVYMLCATFYGEGLKRGYRDGVAEVRQEAGYHAQACHWMVTGVDVNRFGEAEMAKVKAAGLEKLWHPLELQCDSLDRLAKGKP